MTKQAGLTVALSVLVLGVLGSTAARAAVTVYTSQAAFDAAFPAAQHINFDSLNPGPNGKVLPPTVTVGGDTFTFSSTFGSLLALPSGNPGEFGDYGSGVVFLSAQTYGHALDVLRIRIPASTAFGLDYGAYAVLFNPLTISINGGPPVTAPEPSDTAQFIGFSSTTPIEDIVLEMPAQPDLGVAVMDVIDVSQVPATITPVPEPGGWALLLLGSGLLGAQLRRLRRPVPA